eukprot:CAMPEP_0180191358 /NCGR_PEP_ID=MMETSP0987-20121128/1381_1 /TAXON_ID=697907 /ORGANISM="non described non described, Strain CCMP2293" /LENGTH=247 /DNA_ID=CAMNT_0022145867 /DNA_START=94 /DNA_END=838 /DNA_ORIENTATION=+
MTSRDLALTRGELRLLRNPIRNLLPNPLLNPLLNQRGPPSWVAAEGEGRGGGGGGEAREGHQEVGQCWTLGRVHRRECWTHPEKSLTHAPRPSIRREDGRDVLRAAARPVVRPASGEAVLVEASVAAVARAERPIAHEPLPPLPVVLELIVALAGRALLAARDGIRELLLRHAPAAHAGVPPDPRHREPRARCVHKRVLRRRWELEAETHRRGRVTQAAEVVGLLDQLKKLHAWVRGIFNVEVAALL